MPALLTAFPVVLKYLGSFIWSFIVNLLWKLVAIILLLVLIVLAFTRKKAAPAAV